MNRLPSLVSGLFFGTAMFLGTQLAVAADAVPAVKLTPIKGPLYLLQGKGGNVVASVGEDGVLLVDGDYAEYAAAYNRVLEELSGTPTRFLLNTHWHSDHTGSNQYWAERGSVVIAHENIRKRMSTRQEMKALGRVVEPSPAPALPVITYGDSLALHFNGDDIEVQHVPTGHTDGDSLVYFSRENVVHIGDHMFIGGFPFVDISSGGNVFGFIANVEQVLARADKDTVIVVGHGQKGMVNKAELAAYRDMLVATSTLVKEALAKGESVEQITERGLGEEFASYGQGFIKENAWVGFIAGSL